MWHWNISNTAEGSFSKWSRSKEKSLVKNPRTEKIETAIATTWMIKKDHSKHFDSNKIESQDEFSTIFQNFFLEII